MLKGLKWRQILIALIVTLSVPVLSSCLLYCDLAGGALFSADSKFENADIDDLFLLPDCHNHLKPVSSIGSNALLPGFFPQANAFKELSSFSPLSSSLNQKNLVLRC